MQLLYYYSYTEHARPVETGAINYYIEYNDN